MPPVLLTVRTLHSAAASVEGGVEVGVDGDVVAVVVLAVVGDVVSGGGGVAVAFEVDEASGRVGAAATGTSPT